MGDPLDGDGDDFVSVDCGGLDCDDVDPDINPLAAEGPYGDATCTDTIDNDCDGDIDGDDADCAQVRYGTPFV